MSGRFWEVVGGASSGGILVRLGRDVASPEAPQRLAFGAVVEELESAGDRIRFRRCAGEGPEAGWVSLKLKSGKDLLAQVEGVWEVVSGADKGGIVAREGQDTSSPMLPDRLSFGALIRQLELVGERLHFRRLTGQGPESGWVSLKLQSGKDLVKKKEPKSAAPAPKPQPAPAGSPEDRLNKVPADDGEWNPYVLLQIAPSATDSMIKRAFRQRSLQTHPDQNPDDPDAASKFRQVEEARAFLLDPVKRRGFNWKKGYLVDLANPIYWSSWQVMFEELGDPELEDRKPSDGEAAGPDSGKVDILILGCTALTGMLACDWLSKRPAGGPTWAMAARTPEKLELVAAKFGKGPNYRGSYHVPEPSALEEILPNVKVLCCYQGPPRQSRTDEVIALALKHSCHYVDIAGDVPFHRDMIEKHGEEAKKKDLIVVLHQGFTAMPSDLITLCAVKFLREKHKTECKRACLYTWFMGGGSTGTTFAAGLEADVHDKEGGDDPFCLGGVRKAGVRPEDADPKNAEMDGFSAQWVGPDFVARGDTRIVRRSCDLFEKENPALSYGRNFNFKMRALFPDKMSASFQTFGIAMPIKQRQTLVDNKKVPPIGSGPAERLRKEAINIRVLSAEGENGKEVHCVMRSGPGGFGDGYQSSGTFSAMIAHILLTEWDALPKQRRGFVTAAYLLEETSIWSMLSEMLMKFECHDGRAPQDLFRNILGGMLAIGTDTAALEGGAGDAAAGQAKRLPWLIEGGE
mmetsp:Transcript_33955/g.97638  ORF Transcript_33955/g.97638 Transcript_33955/m.97638 type:complete len:745 (-) Transcript_33955:64-2298(-)